MRGNRYAENDLHRKRGSAADTMGVAGGAGKRTISRESAVSPWSICALRHVIAASGIFRRCEACAVVGSSSSIPMMNDGPCYAQRQGWNRNQQNRSSADLSEGVNASISGLRIYSRILRRMQPGALPNAANR